MAEYIKQEMCDLNGTGEKPVYYRMKIQRNMDMEDFVERITYPGSGLSRGSVIQVMTTVAEHLAYCMAEGAVGHVGWHRYVHAPPRRSEGQGDRLAGW